MKKIIAILGLLSIVSTVAHALTLNDVVLGEDVTESPTYYSFPCSKYIDVMSCGAGNLILEKKCKETLKIEKQSLSCQSLKGDIVVFATVVLNTRFADETLGGTFGYNLNFSSRVTLKSFKTPNGNTEYQIVVK